MRALGIQNRRPWLGGHYSAASATAAAYAAAAVCSLQQQQQPVQMSAIKGSRRSTGRASAMCAQ